MYSASQDTASESWLLIRESRELSFGSQSDGVVTDECPVLVVRSGPDPAARIHKDQLWLLWFSAPVQVDGDGEAVGAGQGRTVSSGHWLRQRLALVSYTLRGASTGLGLTTRLKTSDRPCGA